MVPNQWQQGQMMAQGGLQGGMGGPQAGSGQWHQRPQAGLQGGVAGGLQSGMAQTGAQPGGSNTSLYGGMGQPAGLGQQNGMGQQGGLGQAGQQQAGPGPVQNAGLMGGMGQEGFRQNGGLGYGDRTGQNPAQWQQSVVDTQGATSDGVMLESSTAPTPHVLGAELSGMTEKGEMQLLARTEGRMSDRIIRAITKDGVAIRVIDNGTLFPDKAFIFRGMVGRLDQAEGGGEVVFRPSFSAFIPDDSWAALKLESYRRVLTAVRQRPDIYGKQNVGQNVGHSLE